MKCTKALVALLFIISFTQINAQVLKRRYRGIYQGKIASYELFFGEQKVNVAPANIVLYLDRDSVFIEIDTYKYASAFELNSSKKTINLTAKRPNSGITEQIIIDCKTRSLTRKGLYPQPDALLVRHAKLPRR